MITLDIVNPTIGFLKLTEHMHMILLENSLRSLLRPNQKVILYLRKSRLYSRDHFLILLPKSFLLLFLHILG